MNATEEANAGPHNPIHAQSHEPNENTENEDELREEKSIASALDGDYGNEQIEQNDLERANTEASRSIASALTGDLTNEQDPKSDLEKATTQASGTDHEPVRKIKTAVDWEPNDPGNPQNWPLWKKAYHTSAIGFLAFAVTCGSSLITPATIEIDEYFGVSITAAILTLTVYVLGLAFGPIIAAPISETFGRNVVYKVTAPIFILFNVGAGVSNSFGSLLVCRFFAGLIGGPVLAVGAGTTADIYPTHVRAIASSVFIMMPFLGPSFGPVIGGFAAQYRGWRWTQWCTIIIAGAAFIFVLPAQETYKKIILSRRAKKHGVPGPPKPNMTGLQYVKLLLTVTLIRPVRMLFTEPIVLFFSLYNSFTFSVLYAFFAAYPYTFTKQYNFNTYQNGLTFLGVAIGVILAVATAIFIDRKIYYNKYYKQALLEGKTAVAPERRLYIAMIGSFGIPIGLFWFGWTARPSIHWISPILAGIPFAFGNMAIFLAAALYLIDVYGPLNGASALAANGLARYTMGACFPLFTLQMYETLSIPWATSLLGFLSILMMPIPWVFFKYGPKIRSKSAYDTIKA